MTKKVELITHLNAIEILSKSSNLHKGEFKDYIKEVLKSSSTALDCNRTNAWLFNENHTVLESILSYNSIDDSFSKEASIKQVDVPNYFNFLKKNEIIISNNASKEEINYELLDTFIIPKQITSMIDVPIRSEGKMIGVVCFEHVNKKVTWTD